MIFFCIIAFVCVNRLNFFLSFAKNSLAFDYDRLKVPVVMRWASSYFL